MATVREAREARRRKLSERGAGRLAFITGQLSSLPPDPPSLLSPVEPSPAVEPSHAPAPTIRVSTSQEHERATITSVIPNIEQEIQPFDHNVEHSVQEDSVLPSVIPREANGTSILQKLERYAEIVGNTLNSHVGEQSSSGPTAIGTASRNSLAKSYIGTQFSQDRIISAITAAEKIRLICAAILAILVVIYGQMNINSTSILRGIIASRPIYLLLLTDITIVVGFLMLSGKRGETSVGGSRYTVQETGLVENIRRLLEIAVLVQKAMNAAFIDCSVYAVVLISCVCFQQYWK